MLDSCIYREPPTAHVDVYIITYGDISVWLAEQSLDNVLFSFRVCVHVWHVLFVHMPH